MPEPILRMENITKRFPGILANDNVNLTLYPGEIHALLGENGAGKSTLMNVLTGIYYPSGGEIYFRGKKVNVHNTKCAANMGIGMVHQHFMLVDSLSVAENIFITSGKCPALLNRVKMNERVRKFSESVNLPIDPAVKIWQLSIGEQQRVEIIKLLFFGAEVLILDEPTAVLTPQESDELFAALRKLADEGKSVMFITHKLNEVMANADRITVLRGGRSVATMLRGETDRDALTTMMVGRELPPAQTGRKSDSDGGCVLRMENVSALTDRNLVGLDCVNLEANKNEILGIAGVSGNGQKELAEVLAGLRGITAGNIYLEDKLISGKSSRARKDAGVAYIPEDRTGVGLVGSMNMFENAMLRDYYEHPYSKRGIIQKKAVLAQTEKFVKDYDIKNAGLGKPVSLMSGGNIQKLLIAREIDGTPKLIIAAYPVHGLDIGATQFIHNILALQRDSGAAIILISEDIDELFEMSDRIAVLYNGKMVGVSATSDLTYEKVGEMMLGYGGRSGTNDEA